MGIAYGAALTASQPTDPWYEGILPDWTVLSSIAVEPRDVYYDSSSEFIYYVDTFYDRIVKTKIDGSNVTTFGSSGSGTNQFDDPEGIYYDSSSEFIYILDTGNYRIVKTKIDGSGWSTFGSYGSGTNQFDYPEGIHYDSSNGFIYVADYDNNRIVRFRESLIT